MFYLCVLKNAVRFVTLGYDGNALLRVVPQQHLRERPVTADANTRMQHTQIGRAHV